MNGLLEAEIWTIARTEEGNVVFLKPLKGEEIIPIFIGPLEAQSIIVAIENYQVERPLTHDLLLNLADKAGFIFMRAEIYDIKEDVFYARLLFSAPMSTQPIVLDARPSDALALALRRKCPVFVSPLVLEKAGSPMDSVMGGKIESPLTLLRHELEEALVAEDYEKAASIRDKISLLDKDQGKMV
ncbi:bifunctional nuclease family protein [Leadbettera azotonutricia]|uniref:UvrB/UvrC domain protein n=1 Tax=Leadbettera azotonutricia (strain ATCC BAA-888 / DSM 13862 / ZAS-9) TaxID=545695 RepID=F5YCH0_LEAAZ|nr:bifunctional nuclease family protein [Leadbettera azotonutricia]AEF82956.1 UvrB/UvrC domain protein [Leadbettera azotonutricia ZAS-9]